MKLLFENRRRVNPGDTCMIIGFSFDKPRSIKNLTKLVLVLRRGGPDHWLCRSDNVQTEIVGSDDEGLIILPERWLLPIKPAAGECDYVKSPTPFQPAYA